MALSSSSTYTDAVNQYKDNISWRGDSAKAILKLEAIDWLLTLRPEELSTKDRTTKFTSEGLMAEKGLLESFVDKTYEATGTTGINRVTFTRMRPVRV